MKRILNVMIQVATLAAATSAGCGWARVGEVSSTALANPCHTGEYMQTPSLGNANSGCVGRLTNEGTCRCAGTPSKNYCLPGWVWCSTTAIPGQ